MKMKEIITCILVAFIFVGGALLSLDAATPDKVFRCAEYDPRAVVAQDDVEEVSISTNWIKEGWEGSLSTVDGTDYHVEADSYGEVLHKLLKFTQ